MRIKNQELRIKRNYRAGFVPALIHNSLFLILLISLPLTPAFVLAQSSLNSANFKLDGINFGSSFALLTQDQPPPVITEGPNVVDLEATKVVINWKTDSKSSSFIQYGATSAYGEETGTSALVTDHSVTLAGLEPQTTYHFSAISLNLYNGKAQSGDKTFTTTAEAGINAIKVTDIGYDKALVTWRTGAFTKSKLQYGPTTSYGKEISTASRGFLTEHIVQLTGLSSGVEYHIRIVAEDERGTISRSSDFSFTTIAEPKFVRISSHVLSPNAAEILWETNTPASAIVTYAKSNEDKKTTGTPERLIKHTLKLSSLIGDSDYTFTISATDEQGKQATSPPQLFHTTVDTIPPEIDDLKVKLAKSGENLVLTATWKTDETATTEATLETKGGSNGKFEIPPQGEDTTNHILVKTGIEPSLTYTLNAVSKDPFGNQSASSINFISPSVRKNIIALIIESIMKPFGWLAKVVRR
jgi:hypothetical protein